MQYFQQFSLIAHISLEVKVSESYIYEDIFMSCNKPDHVIYERQLQSGMKVIK